jgi:hypothetical protein
MTYLSGTIATGIGGAGNRASSRALGVIKLEELLTRNMLRRGITSSSTASRFYGIGGLAIFLHVHLSPTTPGPCPHQVPQVSQQESRVEQTS